MGSSIKSAARELMADNPEMSYTEALRQVRRDFSGGGGGVAEEVTGQSERQDRALAHVESLVIGEDAKAIVYRIAQAHLLGREMDRRGMSIQVTGGLHALRTPKPTIVSGPYGSGRTSTALAIAELHAAFRGDGTGAVKAAGRSELVGRFEGETSAKVRKMFSDMAGGAIVLDDFDDLYRRSNSDPFGEEAVETINGHLADRQSTTAVVFTATTAWAEEMVAKRSSLYGHVRLAEPTAAQMVKVLHLLAGCRGRSLQVPDDLPGLDTLIGYGGMRTAELIIDSACDIAADRIGASEKSLEALSDDELSTLTAADLTAAVDSEVRHL